MLFLNPNETPPETVTVLSVSSAALTSMDDQTSGPVVAQTRHRGARATSGHAKEGRCGQDSGERPIDWQFTEREDAVVHGA